MSKYQTVILSEQTLKKINGDMWLPDEDLEEVKRALETIRLETIYENTPTWHHPEVIGPIGDKILIKYQ